MLNDPEKDKRFICIVGKDSEINLRYKKGLNADNKQIFWFTESWLATNYYHLGEILIVVKIPDKKVFRRLDVEKTGFLVWRTNMIIFVKKYSLLNPKNFKILNLNYIDYYPYAVDYSIVNDKVSYLDKWLKFSLIYGTSWVEKYKTHYAIQNILSLSVKINRQSALEWYADIIDVYLKISKTTQEIDFIIKNDEITIYETAVEYGNIESIEWVFSRFDKQCLTNADSIYLNIDWGKCLVMACKKNRLDILKCLEKYIPHRMKPKELVNFKICTLPEKIKYLDKKYIDEMIYCACENENVEMLDFIKRIYGEIHTDISKALIMSAEKGYIKIFSWFGINMIKNFRKISKNTMNECLDKATKNGHDKLYYWLNKIEKVLFIMA